ncbi:uncharacterized protein LOC141907221 [Tubulanus polymorphus]|uniref:uncharacterized protein LOC141907221 n=1 Tax=Tubulanus polymorphus TaxID=672921 RepID=UPI003DA3CE88
MAVCAGFDGNRHISRLPTTTNAMEILDRTRNIFFNCNGTAPVNVSVNQSQQMARSSDDSSLTPPALLMVPPGCDPALISSSPTRFPTLPLLDSSRSSVYNVWGGYGSATIGRSISSGQKRPRCSKKPIPDNEKDGRYYERRLRNNLAAKKSRDHRKAREDEIAIRASFLEKENAILRAQVATLREEANSLRQLLLQKRSS